jgi:2-polyprenyl-6-methoxyphenol hydroxylase-like FAD-dependent oxidoreductase
MEQARISRSIAGSIQKLQPTVVKLLGKAPPESLKVWKLLDMEVLSTWVKGRLGLLGDAAHPFLPRRFYLPH